MSVDFTSAEMLVVAMAREIQEGDFLAQGIATPLIQCSFMLAKLTHAPHAYCFYTVGNSLSGEFAPLAFSGIETVNLGLAFACIDFQQLCGQLLPQKKPKEFFRPAQIDPLGNTNNVVIGSWTRPKVRLPGCGGIADVTPYYTQSYAYLPRQDHRNMVAKVDFISGVGYQGGRDISKREKKGLSGQGPHKLITDLAVYAFDEKGRIYPATLHPGVSKAMLREKTGFKLSFKRTLGITPPPAKEELALLREVVDPLGMRDLEFLSGTKRNQKALEIYRKELAGYPHKPDFGGALKIKPHAENNIAGPKN